MEPTKFDDLTKALATSTSRRQALKTIAATTLGGILGLGGIGSAFAKPKCHRAGLGCDTDSKCCSNLCCNGICCASGQTCQNGTCVTCTATGGTCSGNTDCCSGNCSNGFCCASGQVGLSNGSCATPCAVFLGSCSGSCGGGVCLDDISGALYCSSNVTDGNCLTDSDCPKGYFCELDEVCFSVC